MTGIAPISVTPVDGPRAVYLTPMPEGARFALASRKSDAKRTVLVRLLRGAACRPVTLTEIMEWTDLTDRKAAGALLFQLQRKGWLSGDTVPFALPEAAVAEVLPQLLRELSPIGKALLCDDLGLCIAHAGFERSAADRLAALAASVYAFQMRACRTLSPDFCTETACWRAFDGAADMEIAFQPLCVGERTLQLAVCGQARPDGESFTQLAALLSRRYLGSC